MYNVVLLTIHVVKNTISFPQCMTLEIVYYQYIYYFSIDNVRSFLLEIRAA